MFSTGHESDLYQNSDQWLKRKVYLKWGLAEVLGILSVTISICACLPLLKLSVITVHSLPMLQNAMQTFHALRSYTRMTDQHWQSGPSTPSQLWCSLSRKTLICVNELSLLICQGKTVETSDSRMEVSSHRYPLPASTAISIYLILYVMLPCALWDPLMNAVNESLIIMRWTFPVYPDMTSHKWFMT